MLTLLCISTVCTPVCAYGGISGSCRIVATSHRMVLFLTSMPFDVCARVVCTWHGVGCGLCIISHSLAHDKIDFIMCVYVVLIHRDFLAVHRFHRDTMNGSIFSLFSIIPRWTAVASVVIDDYQQLYCKHKQLCFVGLFYTHKNYCCCVWCHYTKPDYTFD